MTRDSLIEIPRAETWMPVSGTFKAYPLAPTIWQWEDGPVIFSKGHHDPGTFAVAAFTAYEWEYGAIGDALEFGWAEVDHWPDWIRADRVEQTWWANRMNAWLHEMGYSYEVQPGGPCRPGAYPVTMVSR